ncbi:hypothetical protein [Halorubrum sp. AJ67]|uniref:hypothetical protein n=1 Tax=Halorubrum sp. AJ67 TaxID=1173487 RepID=UPI0003DBE632|nr:hypothetical protein [Halorubrum sp. AJ67]CDK40339.1 putative signal peptide protein [Halorubrum sp. AJ67]
MQRTRRNLLTASATVCLTGCLDVDGVTYPDEPVPNESDPDRGMPPDDDQAGDPTNDNLGPHPDLAAATRSVVDDTIWFAVSYPSAIDTYREATADVLTIIESVRKSIDGQTDPTAAMAKRLEAAGYDAAERSAAALEPHFEPAGLIRAQTDNHVPELIRFARRNDADRFVEELERMHLSFFQIRTPIYIGRRFSRNPIHNRLLERLAPGGPDKVLAELAAPGYRQFSTLAYQPYSDESGMYPPTFTDEALPQEQRETLRERLGPVIQTDDRTAELFVTVASRPEPASRRGVAFRGAPGDLDGVPVYVQRYSSAGRANERLSAILNAGDTEGREPIVPETNASDDATAWHRYYHREAGSTRKDLDEFPGVQYGYLLQAGEFLLATGFSGDAWEERPQWQGQLVDTWVVA